MSCIHNVWNCYCKVKEEIIDTPCSPVCKHYCTDETSIKNIFNKGPATDITCNCTESSYVTLLEYLFNRMYPDNNIGLFGHTAEQAEDRVVEDMMYLGWNDYMLKTAYDKTTINNPIAYKNNRAKFDNFVDSINRIPHKNYQEKYPLEYRFVLTLILGYLNKLTDSAIIILDNAQSYFNAKIRDVSVEELTKAVNQTRCYVRASNDSKLAEGMRRVEAWFKEYHSKNIPPKELTIAEIEKQLGYKIKVVSD